MIDTERPRAAQAVGITRSHLALRALTRLAADSSKGQIVLNLANRTRTESISATRAPENREGENKHVLGKCSLILLVSVSIHSTNMPIFSVLLLNLISECHG